MSGKAVFVNVLTFSRVPLIFGWLVLAVIQAYMSDGAGSFALAWVAGGMMALSGLTDLFDGRLARKWGVVSSLGKMADPLMDKVFYVVAFPALSWLISHQGESSVHAIMMLVFTILYILRDLWVTFMRSVGSMYGANVAAMWLGKVRTALSFPVAGWIYAYLTMHVFLPETSCWRELWLWSCYAVESAMVAVNLVSFYTYTREYLPYLKKALEHG